MSICKYCGKEFSEHGIFNHIKFCSSNPNSKFEDREYLKQNGVRTCKIIADRKQKEKELDEATRKDRIFICPKCGKEFSLSLTDKEFEKGKYRKYCSRACANSRIHSEETKKKIGTSITKTIYDPNYIKPDSNKRTIKIYTCKVCNSEYTYNIAKGKFCSDKCYQYYMTHKTDFLSKEALEKMSEGGRKGISSQAENRRSKNEIYFCELCEKNFKSVEHNIPMFNNWDADVIIHDFKIAVLWNGPWHYKKIKENHSVKQVQNRDNIKINEIIKAGYVPYIIRDDGKYKPEFVKEKFNEFIEYLKDTKTIDSSLDIIYE